MMKPKILFLLVILFSTTLASCGTPEVGSHLVAKHNLDAVINWNTFPKPTCSIEKNAEVVVEKISVLSRGGPADTVPVILVQTLDKTCTAWDFPENFRAKP